MKAAGTLIGIGLGMGLMAMVSGDAGAEECRAQISKRSFAASTTAERAGDIQFAVQVNGCAASEGTFEYVAQIEVEGKARLETVQAAFDSKDLSGDLLAVVYQGPRGSTLKDVKSIKVTSCGCN